MVTNKSLITIFMSLYFFSSYSQSVFPTFSDIAEWNVERCFFGFQNLCITNNFTYEKDTLLCNNVYSKINLAGLSSGYVRNVGSKTYVRYSTNCDKKEFLMYDFSINIGDTIYIGNSISVASSLDTVPYRLESVDTIQSMGISRRRFEMIPINNSSGNVAGIPMNWIEGIGSEVHPFHSFYCLQDACEVTFLNLCYYSNGVQLYQNPNTDTCYVFSNSIKDPSDETIMICPNPFNSTININTQNIIEISGIYLYNTQGIMVESYTSFSIREPLIEIGKELVSGIYLLEVKTRNSKSRFIRAIKICE